MSTPEKLKAWVEAMERTILAGKSLVAAVNLFESGGPDVQSAWGAVEKAREAFVAACKREAKLWVAASGPDAQTEIPGIGKDDPRAKAKGEKGKGDGPKLLPGRSTGHTT